MILLEDLLDYSLDGLTILFTVKREFETPFTLSPLLESIVHSQTCP